MRKKFQRNQFPPLNEDQESKLRANFEKCTRLNPDDISYWEGIGIEKAHIQYMYKCLRDKIKRENKRKNEINSPEHRVGESEKEAVKKGRNPGKIKSKIYVYCCNSVS